MATVVKAEKKLSSKLMEICKGIESANWNDEVKECRIITKGGNIRIKIEDEKNLSIKRSYIFILRSAEVVLRDVKEIEPYKDDGKVVGLIAKARDGGYIDVFAGENAGLITGNDNKIFVKIN